MIKRCNEMLAKTPSEVKHYTFEFAGELEGAEVLDSASASVSPSGLTLGTPTFSGTKAQLTISGGVSGTAYYVTMTVTTTGGETLQGIGYLKVG